MVKCQGCGEELTDARLRAMPGTTHCAKCVELDGDVPRVTGYMSWEHKTAPEIIIGKDAETLKQYDRKGFHAQLPMNSKNNPRMVASVANLNLSKQIKEEPKLEYDVVNFVPSRCHPERPRATLGGHCLECALKIQATRVRS